jgi:preprotein translocase subunit SecA
MIGFLSKIFGGSKSDKDVKRLQPIVAEINQAITTQYSRYLMTSSRNKTL